MSENIFLISQPKHVEGTHKNRLNEHPKLMLEAIGKKIFSILRFLNLS